MGISIKGIVVGWLVSLVISLLMGLVMGFAGAAMLGAEGAMQMMTPTSLPILMGSMIAALVGGYVAGRVAGDGEAINGALCILLGSIIAAGFTGSDATEDTVSIVLHLTLLPMFGAFGGYIRQRQSAGAAS